MLQENNIYLGDAFELIKQVSDNSIDCIYTDIPYLHNMGGIDKSTELGKQAEKLKLELEAFNKGVDLSILNEFKRVLKKMNMFIWCSNLQLSDILFWAKDYYIDVLVWCKTNPPPFTNNVWLSDVEYCIYIRDKNVYFSKDYKFMSKFYVSATNKFDKGLFEHSTIKPFDLVKRHILNVTQEGDLILDVFSGSGTTAVVCKENNRKYIGFEINSHFYDISINRLNGIDINNQLSLVLR